MYRCLVKEFDHVYRKGWEWTLKTEDGRLLFRGEEESSTNAMYSLTKSVEGLGGLEFSLRVMRSDK